MTMNTCKTCRFYKEMCKDEVGDCHRYPPTIISVSEYDDCATSFPMVDVTNWCGEWQEALPND